MKGHWFCSHCDDVVNMPAPWGRWDARHYVTCNVCHHPTVDWIPDAPAATPGDKPVSPVTAAKLFAQMKESIL